MFTTGHASGLRPWSLAQLDLELHELEVWIHIHVDQGVDATRINEARDLVAAEIRRRTGRPPGPPSALGSASTASPTTASAAQQIHLIEAELAEVVPLATGLVSQASSAPSAVALTAIRGVRARLRQDTEELNATVALGGAASASAGRAVTRLEAMLARVTPAVAIAQRWHAEHPVGESLGMWNERHGTALAGTGLRRAERGGLHYVVAAVAYAAAAGVAVLEAAEQLASFGFHETATAVSQAYTRGDISWEEGERILRSAAGRAILVAAITRGAGAATSRLGGVAARGLRLAPGGLSAGIVAGGIPEG